MTQSDQILWIQKQSLFCASYLQQKTKNTQGDNHEVETPQMRAFGEEQYKVGEDFEYLQ